MRWLGGSRRDFGPLCWCRRQVYLEVVYGLRNGGVSKRVLPLLELDGVVGLRLGSSLRAKRGGPGGCRSVETGQVKEDSVLQRRVLQALPRSVQIFQRNAVSSLQLVQEVERSR